MKTGRAAFTLIELLVVISILALMIAVLLPAIDRAKESGRRTVCAANERQFGIGFATYALDFKNKWLNTTWNGADPNGLQAHLPYWWRMNAGNETNFASWNSDYKMTNSIHLNYVKNYIGGINMTNNTVSGIWGCPSFNLGGFGWGVSNYQTSGNSRRMQSLYSYWSADANTVAGMRLNHREDFSDSLGDGQRLLMTETQFRDTDSGYWYPAHPDQGRQGVAFQIVSGANAPKFGNNQLYRDGHVVYLDNSRLAGADLTTPSSSTAEGLGFMNTTWCLQFYFR